MFNKRDVVTCAPSVFKEKGEAEERQPWQREGGKEGGFVDTLGRRESLPVKLLCVQSALISKVIAWRG